MKEVKQSDVGLKNELKQVSIFEIADNAQKAIQLHELDKRIKNSINNLVTSYAAIGFMLAKINDDKLYLVNGNSSIYEYAKEQYDLAPTTVKNVMAVSQKFFEAHGNFYTIQVKKEFEGFGFSQMIELLAVPDDEISKYTPSMSVRKIRQLRALSNTDTAVKELISTKSELIDFTNYVLNFDYSYIGIDVKIEASSNLGKTAEQIRDYIYSNESNSLFNVIYKIAVTKPKKSDNSFTVEIDNKGVKISTNSRNVSCVDTYAKTTKELTDWFDIYIKKVSDYVKSLVPKTDEVTGQLIIDDSKKYQSLDDAYTYLDDRDEKYLGTGDIIIQTIKQHIKNAYYTTDNNSLKIFKSAEKNKHNKPVYEIKNIASATSASLVIYDENGNEKETKPLINDFKQYFREKAEALISSLEAGEQQ